MAIIPVTTPGESLDLHGRRRRPWTRLAVLRPDPVFGPRRSDGAIAIPATVWHEGLDRRSAPWFDFETGEPLPGITVGASWLGLQAQVRPYRNVIAGHFDKTVERMLAPDGPPATTKTVGPLTPASTTRPSRTSRRGTPDRSVPALSARRR